MPTNSTTPELSDEALKEIEAEIAKRNDATAMESACGEYNCPCHYRLPALCQSLRAARAQTAHFESPDGEGKCRFCGNLRDAPHGHIQKCYCIPTIRQYREENAALRDQLAEAQQRILELETDIDTKRGYL